MHDSAADKRANLATRVRAREFTLAPGVFDLISAKVADRLGFAALYMTGYGISASYMGLPDAGLTSFTDMVNRAGAIASATDTPLIADADTGYGGLLNVHHTVRGYEDAGVAAIQLEDQEFPKKCGHTPGRRVIALEDAVRKIKVAVEARRDQNLLIVARTDARTSLGLDEAIQRGQAFKDAGADVVFIESPEDEGEFERVGRAVDAPLLANMVEAGRSPILDEKALRRLGFTIGLFPATGFAAATAALETAYAHLQQAGSSTDCPVPLQDINEIHRMMGFEEVWAFEKRWAE